MPNIGVKNFYFKFTSNPKPIFKDVNVTFPSNKLSLLTGPSGCGKSTILTLAAGLSATEDQKCEIKGKITIGATNVKNISDTERPKLISMMFQDPNQQFVMQKVEEEIIFALENLQTPSSEIQKRTDEALAFCEIEQLRNREIITLSGGEKQKVVLATLIAMNSDIILLDEPFASIDLTSKRDILNKLVQLKNQQQKTIVISDHDLSGYEGLVDNLFQVHEEQITALPLSQMNTLLNDSHSPQISFAIPRQTEPKIISLTNYVLKTPATTLLKATDFAFHNGCTLLTGASGIGKSSLFYSISKLKKYQGIITLADKNIQKIKNKKYYEQVVLVFQNAADQFLTVTMQEELILAQKNSLSDFWTNAKIKQALVDLNLDHKMDQVVYSLSGGQKKKLQILLMLIRDPQIMLLDEPFAGLDVASVKQVQNLIQTNFLNRGRSAIVISHQIYQFNGFFDYHVNFANQKLQYKEELR
ncbi:ATPase [Fructilactobacillus lindneri]|nr:ATPase [Fructilactobacillus lindneri]POH23537.1 ATPase [Fructilactobacillus lindneri DSM 20690 = JCM 11027]ANZ58883.1 ATPase [Fructilactobacillus lindneri]POG97764.1 ATPase [Fructilactobacillus lindneri]POH00010.1 ATPase [Fructilactobacillus lindneri]